MRFQLPAASGTQHNAGKTCQHNRVVVSGEGLALRIGFRGSMSCEAAWCFAVPSGRTSGNIYLMARKHIS